MKRTVFVVVTEWNFKGLQGCDVSVCANALAAKKQFNREIARKRETTWLGDYKEDELDCLWLEKDYFLAEKDDKFIIINIEEKEVLK